jgi:GNAT superfamily N-acetyltransferase
MITYLNIEDKASVLLLALQVEHLFGKMTGVEEFQQALEQCLTTKNVIGYRKNTEVYGAGIIDKQRNEIAWFVVDTKQRGSGIGTQILERILSELDRKKDIVVQTFADHIPEGEAARTLYKKFGFLDHADGGLNPAGIPTVIMVKSHQ